MPMSTQEYLERVEILTGAKILKNQEVLDLQGKNILAAVDQIYQIALIMQDRLKDYKDLDIVDDLRDAFVNYEALGILLGFFVERVLPKEDDYE